MMANEKETLKMLRYDESTGLYYAVDEYNDMYLSNDFIEWRKLDNIGTEISGIYSDNESHEYIVRCKNDTIFRTKTFELNFSNLTEMKLHDMKKKQQNRKKISFTMKLHDSIKKLST